MMNLVSERLVFDLETVASPNAADLLDPVKPPANYKDAAKIAAYVTEKQAERVAGAGLEADLCEIVAGGFWYQGQTQVRTRADVDEASLIHWLWDAIDRRALVGFNILAFDLPVLIRRSQLLGISVPDVNLDRYRTPHIDLLERLSFNGKLTYRSLAFYCRRFGIPCEDTTLGSEIPALVAAGDWPAVETHCRWDVQKTAALAEKLGWLMSPDDVSEQSRLRQVAG